MIVIADNSPLNYLIRLGQSDLLRNIYGRVLVRRAVLTELTHPEAPAEVRAWASAPPGWLEETQARQLDNGCLQQNGKRAGNRDVSSFGLLIEAFVMARYEQIKKGKP
jgi:hypothetical protein